MTLWKYLNSVVPPHKEARLCGSYTRYKYGQWDHGSSDANWYPGDPEEPDYTLVILLYIAHMIL